MAEPEESAADAPEGEAPKKSKKPLLIGLVLALLLGGGAFYAIYSGMLLEPAGHTKADAGAKEEVAALELPQVSYVPVDPLIISLGPRNDNSHLRFQASLEVEPRYEAEVSSVLPRVIDVLNTYLRALDVRDIEDPSALVELRAQMLRRIQLVTGEGRVRDLLVIEFVLS